MRALFISGQVWFSGTLGREFVEAMYGSWTEAGDAEYFDCVAAHCGF